PRLLAPVHERRRPPARHALSHPRSGGALAVHAPPPAGTSAVVDPHREHILAPPVERVIAHRVPPIRLPLAAIAGRELAGLPDLHAVHERLIRVVDLPELQKHRPPLDLTARRPGGGRQRKTRPVPGEPVVARMSCGLPIPGHRDRLPGLLVVLPPTVARIVARAEPPRPPDPVHVGTG